MSAPLSLTLAETDPTALDEVRALCDRIAAEGVREIDGRDLATWLEGMSEALWATREELREATTHRVSDQEDFTGPFDETDIDYIAPVKYHLSEGAAKQAGDRLREADPLIKFNWAEFVPYNGWIVVLQPGRADLSKYADLCEIDNGQARPTFPDGAARPPAIAGASAPKEPRPDGEVSAPSPKGSTGKVWEIADAAVAAGGWNRAGIMAACTAAGINPATAGTQYSKWKKARGL